MWAALYAREQEEHRLDVVAAEEWTAGDAATIGGLEASVRQLTAVIGGDFTAAPSAELRGLLQSDVVGRAERSAELANRRTDRAMALLWQLRELHHDDESKPGVCSCGRSLTVCTENGVLGAQAEAIRDWESSNLARLAAGERHALPETHPAVVAPPVTRRPVPGDSKRNDRRR
ncbi:MAG: hypothetical protein JWM51_1116 [Microbacteriaceae bacterium]|nr:hypothetical protein [Microbacteriaceae bacterium]